MMAGDNVAKKNGNRDVLRRICRLFFIFSNQLAESEAGARRVRGAFGAPPPLPPLFLVTTSYKFLCSINSCHLITTLQLRRDMKIGITEKFLSYKALQYTSCSVLRREKKRRVLENKWKLRDEGRRSDKRTLILFMMLPVNNKVPRYYHRYRYFLTYFLSIFLLTLS